MPGYVYSGGYLFSGLLADGAKNTSTDYDFGLVKGLSNKLATATGKTLYISDPSDPGYPARAANITGLDWTTDAPMQMVDLGLSSGTKWANMNLGASTETAYGSYYAWGEVEPKTVYSNSTYKWYSGSLSKYCAADGKTVLDAEDDAAWVNMGGSWRMPTKAEIEELVATKSNTTDYTWEKVGDSGWRVTRKSTGKSIFLLWLVVLVAILTILAVQGFIFGPRSCMVRIGTTAGRFFTVLILGTWALLTCLVLMVFPFVPCPAALSNHLALSIFYHHLDPIR